MEVISTAVPLNDVSRVFSSAVELIDLVSNVTAQPEQLDHPRRRAKRTRGRPAKTLRLCLADVQSWENQIALMSVERLNIRANFV